MHGYVFPEKTFQSALPVWGATVSLASIGPAIGFQSALPVWGATPYVADKLLADQFQSALPVWGATVFGSYQSPTANVSIRAPRVGSDSSR